VDEEPADDEQGAGPGAGLDVAADRGVPGGVEGVGELQCWGEAEPGRVGAVGEGVEVEQQLGAEGVGLGLELGVGVWVEVAAAVAVVASSCQGSPPWPSSWPWVKRRRAGCCARSR
jgi:hypothetical protein